MHWIDVNQHGQGWDLDSSEMLMSGDRIRTVVHHDTSYPSQSRAYVDVWRDDRGWVRVADLHWREWATDRVVQPGEGTNGLWAAADQLRHRATIVLDPESVEEG